MPKTLTKLQEQIVGTTLSISATEYVWLSGQINSLNRLKELEMVDQHCYGQVQPRHLKPKLINFDPPSPGGSPGYAPDPFLDGHRLWELGMI